MVHPRPGWAELDAEVIWAACVKTVRDITGQHRKQIKAICLACMSNNIVPVQTDRTPLRRGILSQDNRAIAENCADRIVTMDKGKIISDIMKGGV